MTRPPLTLEDALEEEARVWRESSRSDYDRAISRLIERHASDTESSGDWRVVLAIASATLRRADDLLTESRAVCAERLLTLASASEAAEERGRAATLFLLAWLRLLSSLARGPKTIQMTAPLPVGAAIPYGADIEAIADPGVREQARALAELHLREVERWKAKQDAFHHLNHLAVLLYGGSANSDRDPLWEELRTAATLALELTLDDPDRLILLKTLGGD